MRGKAIVAGFLILGALTALAYNYQITARTTDERTKIGFIGDSITRGTSGEVKAIDVAVSQLGDDFAAVNRGINGSTTADWLPGRSLFNDAVAVFKSQNVRVVAIMLGTNDTRVDKLVSPRVYANNLRRIVKGLLVTGTISRVIINYPPYVAQGARGLWESESLALLEQYRARLDRFDYDQRVVRGDTMAFSDFKRQPRLLADGVHPTATGNKQLGSRWADALQKAQKSDLAKRNQLLPAPFVARLL